ncbi:MAG TPA: diguanylate cyclase [Verrucomicrobia bacterium]|nr:diguanylate cyclase [Verrucomicrobiota bacterium]
MKIGMPISKNLGLESPVHGHFGSAPGFLMVDTETMAAEAMLNANIEHARGGCSPVKALAGDKPDAVLVAGLGAGALNGLRQMGVRVYLVPAGTAAQAIQLFNEGKLKELSDVATCMGHGHGPEGCHGHV